MLVRGCLSIDEAIVVVFIELKNIRLIACSRERERERERAVVLFFTALIDADSREKLQILKYKIRKYY